MEKPGKYMHQQTAVSTPGPPVTVLQLAAQTALREHEGRELVDLDHNALGERSLLLQSGTAKCTMSI